MSVEGSAVWHAVALCVRNSQHAGNDDLKDSDDLESLKSLNHPEPHKGRFLSAMQRGGGRTSTREKLETEQMEAGALVRVRVLVDAGDTQAQRREQ